MHPGQHVVINEELYHGVFIIDQEVEAPIETSNDKWYRIVSLDDEFLAGVFPACWLAENAIIY